MGPEGVRVLWKRVIWPTFRILSDENFRFSVADFRFSLFPGDLTLPIVR